METKECANPDCQVVFVANKFNPDAHQYCGALPCTRLRDSLRQARHYAHHCQDPKWRQALAERKKRERKRRKESKRNSLDGCSDVREAAALDLVVLWLLVGLVQFVSGAGSGQAVGAVLKRCIAKGQELFFDAENMEKSPVGALFLTLARRGNYEFPHAGFL